MVRWLLVAPALLAVLLAVLEGGAFVVAEGDATCSGIVPMKSREKTVSITDFGGVGDGETLNTAAFKNAISHIAQQNAPGGTLLYIPAGVWLTGAFNLTSHMTLFLAKDAVVTATQDTSNWPLIDPLPSYGRGRELPGGRYMSLIHGNGLRDVIITGTLVVSKFLRISLIRLDLHNIMSSYHCSNVVVKNVTVLAPHDSPNTDGVDPGILLYPADSSLNVCIEDCYISTGDDLVAVKSGWDEYGIAYSRPSSGITVLRVTGSSPFAGIAIGSETSGGIENVFAENLDIFKTGIGIHIKTNSGRGGFIRNITISDVNLNNVRKALRITGNAGDHPDDGYDPNALPVVDGLTIKNVWGVGVQQPGSIQGIKDSPFTQICLSNVNLSVTSSREVPWTCAEVSGGALEVQPSPCAELTSVNGIRFCTNVV
ncbi:hypothetical protein B296_00057335 [Ensete ventricosum]|uniref:Pectate lyase superfamily protein domain-containing protein n=1 Tax=Ensete ventricosum TaxID=4639 RepID=A0A426X6B9_ENSVE|nr:hypothetical protein B296_00057335 [Ensete ventricosum]